MLSCAPMDKELRAYARRQPGCKALMGLYGIGHLTAVTILAELGDARRFSSSREAVRYSRPGHHRPPVRSAPRSRPPLPPGTARVALGAIRGRPVLLTARAAPTASTTCRRPSDSGGNRACLALARKLLKRSYHTLRELGEQALQPA